jgi:peptidoglycan/LPS O-acetylase OafA/YrhL
LNAAANASPPPSASENGMTHDRLLYLDGWRGIAILTVLVGHFTRFSSAGGTGVEIFFVLSGRLMAQILFVERYPLPIFFQRRLARVVPALAILVVAMLSLSVISSRFFGGRSYATMTDALTTLSFTSNYASALFGTRSILEHTWSLAVEEHSYILLAFVAVLVRRRSSSAACLLLLVALLCMANGLWLAFHFPGRELDHEVYWRTDVRAASVFLSAAIYLLIRGRTMPTYLGPLAFGLGMILTPAPAEIKYTLGTLCFALAVNALEAAPPGILKALSWKPLVGVGLISYSLYLWQQPFYAFKAQLHAPVALGLALLAAVGSYFTVERPARRYLNELASRWLDPARRRQSHSGSPKPPHQDAPATGQVAQAPVLLPGAAHRHTSHGAMTDPACPTTSSDWSR